MLCLTEIDASKCVLFFRIGCARHTKKNFLNFFIRHCRVHLQRSGANLALQSPGKSPCLPQTRSVPQLARSVALPPANPLRTLASRLPGQSICFQLAWSVPLPPARPVSPLASSLPGQSPCIPQTRSVPLSVPLPPARPVSCTAFR